MNLPSTVAILSDDVLTDVAFSVANAAVLRPGIPMTKEKVDGYIAGLIAFGSRVQCVDARLPNGKPVTWTQSQGWQIGKQSMADRSVGHMTGRRIRDEEDNLGIGRVASLKGGDIGIAIFMSGDGGSIEKITSLKKVLPLPEDVVAILRTEHGVDRVAVTDVVLGMDRDEIISVRDNSPSAITILERSGVDITSGERVEIVRGLASYFGTGVIVNASGDMSLPINSISESDLNQCRIDRRLKENIRNDLDTTVELTKGNRL